MAVGSLAVTPVKVMKPVLVTTMLYEIVSPSVYGPLDVSLLRIDSDGGGIQPEVSFCSKSLQKMSQYGMTWLDGAEAGPCPMAFVARTVKV